MLLFLLGASRIKDLFASFVFDSGHDDTLMLAPDRGLTSNGDAHLLLAHTGVGQNQNIHKIHELVRKLISHFFLFFSFDLYIFAASNPTHRKHSSWKDIKNIHYPCSR